MGLESPGSRVERNARMIGIWDRVPTLAETVAKIDAVTPQDVRQFIGQMGEGRAAMALYGPADTAPSLDALKARLVA
jgi:hypothetical protein